MVIFLFAWLWVPGLLALLFGVLWLADWLVRRVAGFAHAYLVPLWAFLLVYWLDLVFCLAIAGGGIWLAVALVRWLVLIVRLARLRAYYRRLDAAQERRYEAARHKLDAALSETERRMGERAARSAVRHKHNDRPRP